MRSWEGVVKMSEILCVNNLNKGKILKDISFSVDQNEMVAIMGPSGSGKSTLLYNVSGMDRADGGLVRFENMDIVSLSEEERAHLRLHQMGFVFQNMNMLSNLNVKDNIIYPALHMKGAKKRRKEIEKEAERLMHKFGIETLGDRKVTQISGGQLQRACICRSMMNHPKIIFADEPTGALNQSASKEVMDAFVTLNKEGTTILLVTHDSKVAAMCNRIIFILDGQIHGEFVNEQNRSGIKEREERIYTWLNEMGW